LKKKLHIDLNVLASAIRSGDEDVFREFYLDYLDSMVAFLTKILRSEDDARDVAQDTFAMLWENRATFNPHTSIKGYVGSMARNLAFKVLRNRQGRGLEIDDMHLWQGEFAGMTDEVVISNETEMLIRGVLDNMPPQRRKVFELSRRDGMTYNEIAQELGVSYNTVLTHIRLAKDEIAKALSVLLLFLVLRG
jgi:RNA polymerase sigma-70 factor (ECF subfamily)